MTRRSIRLERCYRCGYVWRLRRRSARICARCKSPSFSVPKLFVGTYGGGLGIREVLQPHRKAIDRLARAFGADLFVFGSVARAMARRDSDVDLLVEWRRDANILDHVRLRRGLEAALGRKVDLVTEESLRWLMRPRVLAEMVPL
jgi:uncharacterized protein